MIFNTTNKIKFAQEYTLAGLTLDHYNSIDSRQEEKKDPMDYLIEEMEKMNLNILQGTKMIKTEMPDDIADIMRRGWQYIEDTQTPVGMNHIYTIDEMKTFWSKKVTAQCRWYAEQLTYLTGALTDGTITSEECVSASEFLRSILKEQK